MLVTTPFAVCGSAPAPIMLASHAEGSNLGIHGAELEVGAGSTAGADETSSVTSGGGICASCDVDVGLDCAGAATLVVVVFEYARSRFTSLGK